MDISRALEISPKNAEILTNKGVIEEALLHPSEAITCYKAAIAAEPTYSLAYFNAGNIFYKQKSWEIAVTYFTKVNELMIGFWIGTGIDWTCS